MTPEEFIETAERLLVEPCKEADKRSAISRAYYGALHASRFHLPPSFTPTSQQMRSAGSHKAVIDHLVLWGNAATPGETRALEAARTLAQLERARKKADYELDHEVNLGDVRSCVKRSKRIVRLVRDARASFDNNQHSRRA